MDLLYGLRVRVSPGGVERVVLLHFINPRLFKRAVSLVGTDPKSGKLWDNYVMFETSCVLPRSLPSRLEHS